MRVPVRGLRSFCAAGLVLLAGMAAGRTPVDERSTSPSAKERNLSREQLLEVSDYVLRCIDRQGAGRASADAVTGVALDSAVATGRDLVMANYFALHDRGMPRKQRSMNSEERKLSVAGMITGWRMDSRYGKPEQQIVARMMLAYVFAPHLTGDCSASPTIKTTLEHVEVK